MRFLLWLGWISLGKKKNHINPYKMKVMGIKHDLGKGHVLFDSSEGKHNLYFYRSLFPHILSM